MLERMRQTLIPSLLRSLVLVGLVACGDGGLDPLPLSIAIEASRVTAAPGESIDFVVTARGGSLVGVAVDYGDDTIDLFGAGGARTARVTFSHAFSVAGVYQVRATVTDAVAGNKDAGVEIRIP
jgi:hypothetical protein